MDTLLMRMAICELVNFPSIPVKVTINEYIEISKVFSTLKSNTFINGILDKILNDLNQQGRIQKAGRGLRD
jgi:N utilization substance protein B